MNARWTPALALCGVVALACGGGGGSSSGSPGSTGPTGPTGTPTSGGCQFTVSGAMSGAGYRCDDGSPLLSQQHVIGEDSSFGLEGSGHVGEANFGQLVVRIVLPGAPAVGTYTFTDPASTHQHCMVDLVRLASDSTTVLQDWYSGTTVVPTVGIAGSCTLALTSVGAPQAQPVYGDVYPAHGTLRASLPAKPNTSTTGEVTVELTF